MTTARSIGPSSTLGTAKDLAVIVPCHNAASTLAQQLDRLVEERWTRPWCIVVVDNGSTDETREVATRYSDRGVAVVTANDGRGVGYARNAGARAVNATAVAFCDGDDVIAPGWVAAIGDALDEHALVGGRIETGSLNEPWLAGSRPMASKGRLAQFAGTAFAPGGNCGIRSDLYHRLGGFDEGFDGLEDIEFALRARALGVRAVGVPNAVIAYRLRPSARDLWRQGTFYGKGKPLLIIRARELGLGAPSRVEGLRSWAWLLVHLPALRNRAGRYQWLWVVAFRIGVLRRAIQLRRLYL